MIISAIRPAERAADLNRVPVPIGADMFFSPRTMLGLHSGSWVWSATQSRTTYTGRPMVIAPVIFAISSSAKAQCRIFSPAHRGPRGTARADETTRPPGHDGQ